MNSKCSFRVAHLNLNRMMEGEEFEFYLQRIQNELRIDNRKRGLTDQVPLFRNIFYPGDNFVNDSISLQSQVNIYRARC